MKVHGAQEAIAALAAKPPAAAPLAEDKSKSFKISNLFGKRPSQPDQAVASSAAAAPSSEPHGKGAGSSPGSRSASADAHAERNSLSLMRTANGTEASWKASRAASGNVVDPANGSSSGGSVVGVGRLGSQQRRASLKRDSNPPSLGGLVVPAGHAFEGKRKLTLVDETSPAVAPPPKASGGFVGLLFGSSATAPAGSSGSSSSSNNGGGPGSAAGEGGGGGVDGRGASTAVLVSDVAAWTRLVERADLYFQLGLEDGDEEASGRGVCREFVTWSPCMQSNDFHICL
jgi:hypothetical protein